MAYKGKWGATVNGLKRKKAGKGAQQKATTNHRCAIG
jgi:hypothetical protein